MSTTDTPVKGKSTIGGFFKKLFMIIILLVLLALGLGYAMTRVTYSDGDRAGVVSKFSRKGVIFKTYEGELNVGAQGQVGNMADNTWKFTVYATDEAPMAKTLEDAMLSGKRVRLHYEQRYLKFPWMGETEYFVIRADQSN